MQVFHDWIEVTKKEAKNSIDSIRRDSSRFILRSKVHTPIFIAGTKRNSTLEGSQRFRRLKGISNDDGSRGEAMHQPRARGLIQAWKIYFTV